MHRTLYIVGNGFDLFHGLATSFIDFKDHVSERAVDVYRAVDRYIDVKENWSDLEASLATLDTDGVIQDLGHFAASYGSDDWSDSGHYDFQYEVENVIAALSVNMLKALGNWISELPVSSVLPRLSYLPRDALYLTFNYTDTLERTYSIPSGNVLHIHGQAGIDGSELVLGHAWAAAQRTPLNDSRLIEEQDPRSTEVNELLEEYFFGTFKDSQRIIDDFQPAFAALEGVRKVILLGHSLGEVDRQYFSELLRRKNILEAQWIVACRSLEEAAEKSEVLYYLGVPERNLQTLPWDQL